MPPMKQSRFVYLPSYLSTLQSDNDGDQCCIHFDIISIIIIIYIYNIYKYHQATALVSIDLSAAFDLVDHNVLVKCLDNYYGFSATVLDWFRSFHPDRSQCVILGNARSKSIPVFQGVPLGSVLGARLYT